MSEFVAYIKNEHLIVDMHSTSHYNMSVSNKHIHNIKITNKFAHVKTKGDINIMNLAKNRNQNGELITLQQACSESNLGSNTVRRLADESGAVRKIGKNYRIKKSVFFDYIETMYGM